MFFEVVLSQCVERASEEFCFIHRGGIVSRLLTGKRGVCTELRDWKVLSVLCDVNDLTVEWQSGMQGKYSKLSVCLIN